MHNRSIVTTLLTGISLLLTIGAQAQLQPPEPPHGSGSGTKKVSPPAATSGAKTQSEAATKEVSLGTIEASDAKVKSALESHNLEGMKKAAGKEGAIVGTVAELFTPRSGKFLKLNFDADYAKAATGLVFTKSWSKFPDLAKLKGKKVLLTGKITEYQNSYEIILNGPDQIKVVK